MKNLWKKVYGTAVGTSVLVTPTLASAAGKDPEQLVKVLRTGFQISFSECSKRRNLRLYGDWFYVLVIK